MLSHTVLPQAEDPTRVLFMGDSVTAYGRIIDALANQLASETTSYFNGGIEGYNIQQEVEFFLRYQKDIRPDVIVHQLHVNDLFPSSYPVRTGDGKVRIYSPRVRTVEVNQTLYRYSQLYRFLFAQLSSKPSKDELKDAAFKALQTMRDYTRDNGITYYLVFFPTLQPLAEWTAYDKDTLDYLTRVVRELGLDVVELQDVAERLFAQGIDPGNLPGDTWHPNQRMADEAATYILQKIPALRTRLNSPPTTAKTDTRTNGQL
jgi:hypothetical protein